MIVHIIEPTLRDKLELASTRGAEAAVHDFPVETNPYVRNTLEYLAWNVAFTGIGQVGQGRAFH
jgi:hypothetical protein